jgi:hypothetical protein
MLALLVVYFVQVARVVDIPVASAALAVSKRLKDLQWRGLLLAVLDVGRVPPLVVAMAADSCLRGLGLSW